MMEGALGTQVNTVYELITNVVNSMVPATENELLIEHQQTDFGQHYDNIETQLNSNDTLEYQIKIEIDQDENLETESKSKLEEEVTKFNDNLLTSTNEFILMTAFKRAASEFIKQYLDSKSDETSIKFHDKSISTREISLYNRITILLDFQIYILLEKENKLVKSSLYSTIAYVSETLLSISTSVVDTFWYYLEARIGIFQTSIFDKLITSDRIAMLEICNSLTDKFNNQKSGKTDTYKKDTFNDYFQSRVRAYIANLFNLEDNTGLNKYFNCANIVSHESIYSTSNRDDTFLRDISTINKLFRDPYYYLKASNYKYLPKIVDTMTKVCHYLLDEESKWYKLAPSKDQYLIKKSIATGSDEEKIAKLSSRVFFPETYSLAAFVDNKRNATFDAIKKEDASYLSKQFDSSKVRQVCLFQIYLISCLFYEFSNKNKKLFLKSLSETTNLKHFVEDTIPEHMVLNFNRLKTEIPKRYKSMNVPFAAFLEQVMITENYWWAWLIYGKDSSGKPLFANKLLQNEELLRVSELNKTILPLKEKKYFNTYATPQLSRKMKVSTGLEKLEKPILNRQENEEDISSRLETAMKELEGKSGPELESLCQAHNVNLWKLLKKNRAQKWVSFGEMITQANLAGDIDVVKTEEELLDDEVQESMAMEVDEEKEEKNNSGDEMGVDDKTEQEKVETEDNTTPEIESEEKPTEDESSGNKRKLEESEESEEPTSKKQKN
ncbi:hypothetical protein CAAN1_11S03950 [[Candida] anglica]|uniref:Uncharacterized protein n=1 Tax=[Candida] anglica TaxID=148631 RepID=A0ABP0EHV2_9ASCO